MIVIHLSKQQITCNTGDALKYGSKNAFGEASWVKHKARWDKIDSTVCLGCCLVTLKYFWRDRAIVGKTAWAASYGSMAEPPPWN